MIREFCDKCKKEIGDNYIGDRLEGKVDDFMLEVIVGYNGVWNKGALCLACLKELLIKLLAAEE